MCKLSIMSVKKHKSCCFIGHRNIEVNEAIINRIKEVVEMLVTRENVSTFIFGSNSMFNDLCHEIVTELKKNYPFIKRAFMTCKNEVCILEGDRLRKEKTFSSVMKKEIHLLGFEEELEFQTKFTSGKAC